MNETLISAEESRRRAIEEKVRDHKLKPPSGNVRSAATKAVLVTTEMFCPDLNVIERKGIITAEAVVGMNLYKDLFAGFRNVVGGHSGVVQYALRDIRIQAIDELKAEAVRSGANAVIAVDFDYQEIGANGSTMLMLVASGTAVVTEG